MIDYSGSARRFGYYDPYATEEFGCRCGWRGSFEGLSTETFEELFDASCPKCGTMLAIVSFPSADEVRQAARQGNEEASRDLKNVRKREAFLQRYEARELKSPTELPEIEGTGLEFEWDAVEESGQREVVIRLRGGPEVWREVEAWENWPHFVEVRRILRERYGARFKSLTATAAADLYLYGDNMLARGRVEARRDAVPAGGGVDQEGDRIGGERRALVRAQWRSPSPAQRPRPRSTGLWTRRVAGRQRPGESRSSTAPGRRPSGLEQSA